MSGLYPTSYLLRSSLVDVVVVGSGVAGALLAWKLAEAGLKVTILEAGPRVHRQQAVERFRQSVVKSLDSPYPQAKHAPSPQLQNLESHLRQEGPELFMGVYQRQVGGTTWHWLGTAMRLLPEDFAMRTLYGQGFDWPIDYSELEPWYGTAEVCLGVSGEGDLGSPRSQSYPMPAIRPATVDGEFAAAANTLGLRVSSLPQARNSRAYEGRPLCCGSASCIPICPVGAKYDASVHVTKAEKAGAEVRENHVVSRLETDENSRITAAHFLRPDGTSGRLAGDVFVLAAHAIETPRLLLNSHCERWPRGLANSSDQLGRNLMGGSAQLSWGLAPRPVFPYRAPQATSGLFEYRSGPHRKQRSGFVTTIATDGWPAGQDALSLLLAQGLKGPALRKAFRDHVSRQVALVSNCEELPHPDNRVLTDPHWPDALGIARPVIRYQRASKYTQDGLEVAKELHQELFQSLGVEDINHAPSTDPAYILGTTRMGKNRKDSVVDSQLRCHDHSNLYLLSSGVFPTTGSAPPTLTVAALALRLAESLIHG